ncbi:MAG: hypothetical protein ISS91_04285, partial [Candidatus Omnitrophica bacterium]|nr:hypothetical protein [Candidatus Omnitrophota bacterium]
MWVLKAKYKTAMRILAIILAGAFLVLDVAWANPEIFTSQNTLARYTALRDSSIAHKAVELYRGRTAASREHIFPVSEGPLLDTLRRQGAASLPLPSDRT